MTHTSFPSSLTLTESSTPTTSGKVSFRSSSSPVKEGLVALDALGKAALMKGAMVKEELMITALVALSSLVKEAQVIEGSVKEARKIKKTQNNKDFQMLHRKEHPKSLPLFKKDSVMKLNLCLRPSRHPAVSQLFSPLTLYSP